jgi:cytochrome b
VERPIRVWDAPVRVVHWAIVVLIAFSWWCAENRIMDWHVRSGLTVLALVVFRLIWGVIGGSTARFARFVRGPRAVAEYLRAGSPHAGHSPLGALSVVALLAVLVVQLGTGLFAVDVDGIDSGPLSFLVSFEAARSAAEVHEVSFDLLLGLIALHVAAVLFYVLVRKQPLIRRMITGTDSTLVPGAASLVPAPAWRLVLAALTAGGLAWWINRGLGL